MEPPRIRWVMSAYNNKKLMPSETHFDFSINYNKNFKKRMTRATYTYVHKVATLDTN